MDFDKLLYDLAEDKGWSIVHDKDDDLYRLQLQIPGDRFQDVFVSFRNDPEGWHIATIWSVIADSADLFEKREPVDLLRLNWSSLYGALGVRKEEVILLQNQLCEEANWNEVGRAIHYIGNAADAMEREVYGDVDER